MTHEEWLATEYNGPRTEAEWNTWARQHDRPGWHWADVWGADE
jgi:hypothetical protein